jgi:alkylation response protein AidB-like acyl-CoA dehydrogenase
MLMGASINRTRRLFGRVIEYIRRSKVNGEPMASLSWLRDRIGALAAEIEVGRQLLMHCVAMAEQGAVPIHEAAMSKCYSAELMERFGEAALDLLGMQATLSEDAANPPAAGEIEQYLRQSIMFVIGGGTVEIQRNLIAQRGLGLPR